MSNSRLFSAARKLRKQIVDKPSHGNYSFVRVKRFIDFSVQAFVFNPTLLKRQMETAKTFLKLYYSPRAAMSDVIDKGNWIYGAVAVLAIAFVFQMTITKRIHNVYGEIDFNQFYVEQLSQGQFPTTSTSNSEMTEDELIEQRQAMYEAAYQAWQKADAERRRLPVVGDKGLWLFSFQETGFFTELASLTVFYVPLTILLLVMFAPVGSFGLVLRREYGVLLACTLMGWAAAHLPFAIVGVVLMKASVDANVLLALWLLSSLYFGVLMVFALRTVFGADYSKAILTISLSWLGISLGGYVFRYVSPFLFSPFILFYAFMYFRGEVGTLGQSLRNKQNFKRFLENATINPKDADAHFQLGLIHLQRRQEKEAIERFKRSLEIDPQEPDANFQMGRIARQQGNLQDAINHFSIVVDHNDKYSNSEIWREIGATYLAANMLMESREALEKYTERRPFDPEGLYLMGQVFNKLNETQNAEEMYRRCIEAVDTMPYYRRGEVRKWSKLARQNQ